MSRGEVEQRLAVIETAGAVWQAWSSGIEAGSIKSYPDLMRAMAAELVDANRQFDLAAFLKACGATQ